MCTENSYEDLQDVNWVQIPGAMYIAKYKFLENEYKIIITNLTEVFGECLKETEIQTRFLSNNPYAEMKTKVIIKNVKETLESNITDESTIEVNSSEKGLNIQLKFFVHQVSFIFNLEPAVLSCEKLQTHVIIPTISYAMVIQQENLRLHKKIKDLENKLDSASSSRSLQSNSKLNDFSNNSYVSEARMLEVFIEMQNTSRKYFRGKEKSTESQNKLSSRFSSPTEEQIVKPVLSVKREITEVSKYEPEIKYEETIIDNLKTESSQTTTVQISDIKTKKKKKCLKF